MSASIEDVAAALGVSVRGVRLRIDALDGTVSPFIRQGPNNRSLFTDTAVGMLRYLEEVRKSKGLSIRAAASIVRREERERYEQKDEAAQRQTRDKQALGEGAEWVRLLLDEKDRAIERLEEEVASLRAQLERLLPLALPRPRRWWPFSRKAS